MPEGMGYPKGKGILGKVSQVILELMLVKDLMKN